MKKRSVLVIALAALAVMLFLTGCGGGGEIVRTVEDIDKSTRLITVTEVSNVENEANFSVYELQYIKDERMFKVNFNPYMQPALDYLRENSKPSDKVLTWWDNGHVIRGYARREPIIYTPCREILETVVKGKWDQSELGEFSSKEDATNVAYALLADSPSITKGIMKRYGARWVFVARIDQKKIVGMTMLLGEDMSAYLDELDEPKMSVQHKILFKMSDGWPVKGFQLRYEDDYAFVYELVE
ncbi:hypothetical protein KY362_05335 [Candidatus Woesearchaeota archaeon]|nr:hypothetical protein [Candidatus Woesearchaeota archaeon]